ncbi:hypothetical protein SteCoe_32730 [Stentor coeruleus]|uniref:Uncharacterized protein n=1 Tax=Stentor coeruleus TaxID=5963 RepID=A0A1R2AYF2_9CILI|nr:hypothetical protein SteCoe_32730 [Stentor coeruleus]
MGLAPDSWCQNCREITTDYLSKFKCCYYVYCSRKCHATKCSKGDEYDLAKCMRCYRYCDWYKSMCPKCNNDISVVRG